MVVFLDTYAIVEIQRQNPNYKSYSDIEAISTIFNAVEVYYVFLRELRAEEGKKAYLTVKSIMVNMDDDVIEEAMKFKLMNKKKRFSFTDCIGYCIALKKNAVFLTGGYAFKGMEGVEFVK